MVTSGLQDYLELIYNKIANNEEVKAIDIANQFNISRPSVSEALIRLSDMDLIVYEARRGIKITQKGADEAKKVIRKHKVLFDFFHEILKIDDKNADENACKIEHVIDENIIEQINSFTEFCKSNSISMQ